jgi:hypothetical protein
MPDILQGSLGVIEEFFGTELVEDDKQPSRMAQGINPERIMRLPEAQRKALGSALSALAKESATKVEDLSSLLRSGEQGDRAPTMLIGHGWPGTNWRTVDQGLRVVAYFRRVLVDDPFDPLGLFFGHRPEETYCGLERLAKLRPLIAGGYIGFFPPSLIEHFSNLGDPDIVKESTRRAVKHEKRRWQQLADEGMCGTMILQMPRSPYWDPVLDRLAASVALGLDAMDTTGDKYVLKYLGKDLTAVPTKLARFRLPRLELLSPRDLASLLSSDEVLAEVDAVLDSALRSIPDGLCGDPERAARWIDERLTYEFRGALRRLRGALRGIPDGAKLGGAGAAVGASVLAGVLTGSPDLALAVGAAGAAADVTASWLYRRQRRLKNKPAVRVLTHLSRESSAHP